MDPLNSPKVEADNNYQNIPDFPPVLDPNAPPPGAPPPFQEPPPADDLLKSAPIPAEEPNNSKEPVDGAKSSEPAGDADSNPIEPPTKNKKKGGKKDKTAANQEKIEKLYKKLSVCNYAFMAVFGVWILLLVLLVVLHLHKSGVYFLPFLAPQLPPKP